MPIMELVVRAVYDGVNILNRFHFVGGGTPASISWSLALQHAFGLVDVGLVFPSDTPFAKWRECVNDGVIFTFAESKDMYSDTDFYGRGYPNTVTGLAVSGQGMSRYDAYSIVSSRILLSVRKGHKRFAGVSEGNVDSFGHLTEDMTASLQDLCDVLSEPLSYDDDGNTLTFTSSVLSFDDYTNPDNGKTYKKQYSTAALQLEHAAVGVSWFPEDRVTTQNTRKR